MKNSFGGYNKNTKKNQMQNLHEESQRYYYWNVETEETSWEVPQVLIQADPLPPAFVNIKTNSATVGVDDSNMLSAPMLSTPTIVCFGKKQRFIGIVGAASTMMNPKNSISQIKRLIIKQFSDPDLQRDLKSLPYTVTEGPDGYPLIQARYLGEVKAFTPTQVFAMMLSNMKEIAEKNLNAAVNDCCIGTPVYFTDVQRRAVLDAATIAGLNPLRLLHETTATALACGIYKTDLPENDQLNVAFVDIGHASIPGDVIESTGYGIDWTLDGIHRKLYLRTGFMNSTVFTRTEA
ncbi:heat shock 70 kDa protein 15-like [Lathyrus oleraceus]|uniref:heat shock 70 kDa protein 15-like n=1 Tax=Pisum sativum TaxID=3888 RepID=UPI0021D12406|nr:heat shock 70 kDa protein 15-like [Pisum sativum]